jgi:hypothetical protein
MTSFRCSSTKKSKLLCCAPSVQETILNLSSSGMLPGISASIPKYVSSFTPEPESSFSLVEILLQTLLTELLTTFFLSSIVLVALTFEFQFNKSDRSGALTSSAELFIIFAISSGTVICQSKLSVLSNIFHQFHIFDESQTLP